MIGVGGYFLKSKTSGFSIFGLDPNNKIFPICYALVEGEIKYRMWIFQLLDDDIKFDNDYS